MDDRDRLFQEAEESLWAFFKEREAPSYENVKKWIENYLAFQLDMIGTYPSLKDTLDRAELTTQIADKYCRDQSVTKDLGNFLTSSDDNTPWLQDLENNNEIQWHYWNQYANYLTQHQHWSKDVVQSIGKDTWNILSLTANPKDSGTFNKKGLVVGNVQSGKTSNYIGLMCRAADAGYRFIVILAAITNDLREQTQQRIEEGFIGYQLTGSNGIQYVGVGEFQRGANTRRPNPGTTRNDDFKKSKMKTLLQIQVENTKEPWVFVVKKNTSTLRNLTNWLKANRDQDSQLFLIDDEADSASINTLHSKEKISRINGQIRELISLFPKNVYVGYTATPYANILIDKNEIDAKHGHDLFPRNFIYTLNPADSYFGAAEILRDIEPDDEQLISTPKYVRFIYDIETIPPNKKDLEIPVMPPSMQAALRTFILASAIRVRRAGKDVHTTMMLNISPYNPVQRKLQIRVDEYLDDVLKPAFKAYGSKAPDIACRNSSEIRAIKAVWDEEYTDSGLTWEEVFPHISPLVKSLHSALINSKSKESLNYRERTEHVIAIGGYRLSRGLTLEGLLVSYFSRNARAYDTLMQMSRWFGHRVGYEDICRIWMTEASAGWCRFVADATEDLIDDLIVMQQKNATPLEFGHKVRAHPSTLMVTAANKMGAGQLIRSGSLSGRFIESTVLLREDDAIEANSEAAYRLLRSLENGGFAWKLEKAGGRSTRGVLFQQVPSSYIEGFIGAFRSAHAKNRDAVLHDSEKILEYVGFLEEDGYPMWDILFAGVETRAESSLSFKACGQKLYRQRRYPGAETREDCIYIGNKFRISTKGIEACGLDEATIEKIKEEFDNPTNGGRKRSSIDKMYRESRKRPLLVIHFLDVKFKDETEYENALEGLNTQGKSSGFRKMEKRDWSSSDLSIALAAWSMSLPTLKSERYVDYVFNQVALTGIGIDDDFDDDERFEYEDD